MKWRLALCAVVCSGAIAGAMLSLHAKVEDSSTEGATISGRVLVNGELREGLLVNCEPAAGGHVQRTTTDRSGRYAFSGVPPGATRVSCHGSELSRFGSTPDEELFAVAGASYELELSWTIECATVSGRVFAHTGEALAGVNVIAIYEADHASPVHFQTITAQDGSYRVELYPARTYVLTVGRRASDEARREVDAGETGVDFTLPELGLLPLRLVDGLTGEGVPTGVETHFVSWRVSGSTEFRHTTDSLLPDGTARLQLPVGMVDISVHVNQLGFAPATVRGIQVTSAGKRAPLVVELARGVEVELAFVDDAGRAGARPDGHALFLLEESQLPLVRGPSEHPPNGNFGGARLWLGDSSLVNQWLRPDDEGRARMTSLARGRYTLRAFPDDLQLTPESFELTGKESEGIEIRWRTR